MRILFANLAFERLLDSALAFWTIKQYLIDQKNSTKESSFQEIRKLLIQYCPIVKSNVFMVDITMNDE